MLTIVRAAHGACCDGISTVDAALSEKMARCDSHESELRALLGNMCVPLMPNSSGADYHSLSGQDKFGEVPDDDLSAL